MERRAFVRLSAFTALALTLPLAQGCSKPSDDPLAQPLFFSHIADVKTITEAGKAYRKAIAGEDNEDALRKLLSSVSTSTEKDAIQKALDKQVAQDFNANKTVIVSGWVLAVTEARQCALFSILNS